MIRRFTFYLLFLSTLTNQAKSTDLNIKDSTRKINVVIKGDILTPLAGLISQEKSYSGTLEKLLFRRHSIQFTYLSRQRNFSPTPDSYHHVSDIFNLYQLIPEYKFYVSKRKQYSGYYVGGTLAYSNYNDINTYYLSTSPIVTSVNQVSGQSLGFGLMNGIQFYMFKYLTFDFLAGVGLNKTLQRQLVQNNTIETYETFYNPKFNYRFAVNIGVKF